MTEIINLIKFLLTDRIVFLIFEVLILIILIYSRFREVRHTGIIITRGPESWNNFIIAYGVISVILNQVVIASSAFTQYKIIFIKKQR